MRWDELPAQECSVARTLGVIGDRWTLVILRECFSRVRRFEDFRERTGASRRILTERLGKLVDHDILVRVAYQQRPARYEYRLTRKGLDIYPILVTMLHWGDKYYGQDSGPPLILRHQPCDHDFAPLMVCSQCKTPVDAREVTPRAGPGRTVAQRSQRA